MKSLVSFVVSISFLSLAACAVSPEQADDSQQADSTSSEARPHMITHMVRPPMGGERAIEREMLPSEDGFRAENRETLPSEQGARAENRETLPPQGFRAQNGETLPPAPSFCRENGIPSSDCLVPQHLDRNYEVR